MNWPENMAYITCSVSELYGIRFGDWMRRFKTAHSRFFRTSAPPSQYKAWANELSVLQRTFRGADAATASWTVCFEYVFGKSRKNRGSADVVILAGTTTLVLEFKMKREAPDTKDAQQVSKYAKRMKNHYYEQPGQNVVPLIVLGKASCMNGCVTYKDREIEYCSADRLLETISRIVMD